MNYWLVKSEPEAYSWADLVKDGKTSWTGVRNYQARNNLQAMKKGELVLFYHSISDKAIVGVAKVATEAYPGPTTTDGRWLTVDLAPVELDIDAVSGANALLGNLVCALTGLLSLLTELPALIGQISDLIDLINDFLDLADQF